MGGQPYTFSGPRGENNIDITLVSQDLSATISNWKVLDGIITSDHRIIYFEVGQGKTFSKLNVKKRYITKKADWTKFNMELATQIMNMDHCNNLEIRTESIMQAITKACDRAIPKQKIKRKVKPPWWTTDLENRKKIMRKAYRKIEGNEEGKQQRRAEYNRERNEYVKTLRKEKKLSWRRFAGEINENTWGKCFRWIKKGSVDREAPSVLKKENGEYTKTLEETLKYLLDTLIPTEGAMDEIQEPPYRMQLDYTETNREEVKNSIWRMSTSKAPGEDGINALILRKAWPLLGEEITELFSDLLKYAYFPKIWRNGDVVTILKGKDKPREDPKSFRPVSLLPVLGKSLEHLICNRLNDEIDENIAPGQHGFKKGRSTLSAINEVIDWINSRTEKYVMGVFLEISGAFDNIR